MYCTKCGSPNPEGAGFCSECGTPLSDQSQAENTAGDAGKNESTGNNGQNWDAGAGQPGPEPGSAGQAGGLSPEEAALVGTNVEYYAMKFSQLRTGGGMVSWNWSAALFFPYWAIYRKMYKEAIGYLVLSEALTWVMGSAYPSLVVSILLGLFGNWLYLRSVSTHAIAMTAMPEDEKQAYIVKFGGVAQKNVWLLLLAMVVLNWVTLGVFNW